MSSATVYKVSGIILLLGGSLSVIATIGQAFNDNPLSPTWIPTSLIMAVGLLMVLLGLPALYVRQMKRSGGFGLVSFLLFFLACLQFGGASGLTDVVLLPWMTQNGGLANAPLAFIMYFFVSKLLILVGSILFSIATLRVGLLPKGSAILLLVGSVLFILGGRVQAIPYLEYIGEVLFLLSFLWFGQALWLHSGDAPEQASVPVTGVRI